MACRRRRQLRSWPGYTHSRIFPSHGKSAPSPRQPRLTKIDAHKDYLQERLGAAGKIRLPATVLLREIRANGYAGGITQLKEYLREIRPAPPDERAL